MPFLLLLGLAIPAVGALAFHSVATDTRDTAQDLTESTGPNLITLAVAGLGIYAAFKWIEKAK